jgi:aryl-alcohol dehydrogenase-like predicted oxidoreductase
METRSVGSLRATVVGLGCNQFGTRVCDEATSLEVIAEALEAGIAYFDTADEYGSNYFDPTDTAGWGRSEEILGKALRSRRDEVVIATKFGVHPHGDDRRGGASAHWAREALEDSLRRLDTDRIDLYQLHVPDAAVPIEETLGVLEEFVRSGKVREIGCCNFDAAMLRHADASASASETARFVSLQAPLNLFQRGALTELVPVCEELGMAFVPYYPLASGVLTGKYRRGELPAPGTRLRDQVGAQVRDQLLSERAFARIEALEEFAKQRGHSLIELAFGWLLAQPSVASVIAGAARPGQAKANAAAASWILTPEEAADATRAVVEAV